MKCRRCNRDAVDGRTACQYHLNINKDANWRFRRRNAEYKNRERERSYWRRVTRKMNGLCIKCGVPLDPIGDDGRVKCQNCREETYAS